MFVRVSIKPNPLINSLDLIDKIIFFFFVQTQVWQNVVDSEFEVAVSGKKGSYKNLKW